MQGETKKSRTLLEAFGSVGYDDPISFCYTILEYIQRKMMLKKTFPKLKFRLNKTLDKKMCFHFLEHKKAGVDFGAGIIKLHPPLAKAKNLPSQQKKLLIDKYVDKYYQSQEEKLNLALQKAKKQWQKIEKQFYLAIDKIFNHPWPKGKYIAYLSIFNCNPRFLETKTFQNVGTIRNSQFFYFEFSSTSPTNRQKRKVVS